MHQLSSPQKRILSRHRLEVGLARLVLAVSARLPAALRSRLGRGLGHLVRVTLRRPRRIAARNLALCFPALDGAARAALLREHFCQLGEAALELGFLWRGARNDFERRVQVEGMEHWHAARAQGKGVIFLSAHLGSWESCVLYGSLLGRFSALYMPVHNPAFNRLMVQGRERFGTQLIPKDRGLRPLLSALKRGETVGMLADQNVDPSEGVFAPLFGIPASTSYTVARLSQRTGAPVINAFCYRLPRGRGFRLVFRPMPADYPSGDDVRDAATMNAILEAAIGEAPAQYWWVHRRFKDQPAGQPDLYAN
ncbi:MAG: lysophospholipid acyltransferase family protein [Pseudomonadota bacterium]